MSLILWFKEKFKPKPSLKPDCVSSSICVAMACSKLGYKVRIVCKAIKPYMNHAEAQVEINDKWVWVRMQNNPFDIGIEEFPEKKNIQWWSLEDFFANFIKHEKTRVR